MNTRTLYTNPFFHPDYTVGPGVAPDLRGRQELIRLALVGFTTGRELGRKLYDPHPAPKE